MTLFITYKYISDTLMTLSSDKWYPYDIIMTSVFYLGYYTYVSFYITDSHSSHKIVTCAYTYPPNKITVVNNCQL